MTRETGSALVTVRWRGWLYQGLVVAVVVLGVAWLVSNALAQLRARGAHAGFDFLWQPAGFQLGEGWGGDDPGQAMWQAFLAGLLNTLRVAVPGIVLSTLLGTLIGIGRGAREPVVRGLCTTYVEALRNVPLLVQLLMVYFALTHFLPESDQPLQLADGWFLSKGGLAFPWMTSESGSWQWSVPAPETFGVVGGASLTPEFLALWLGLSCYTAAFVAEIVRAGLTSVPQGQKDAAMALGLKGPQQLRYVVLPQALRLIVPALGNQMLNLTKNSSLAVAIGYPDLVSVAGTALNQTGRGFECIAVLMAVYLSLSLLTAAGIHQWNRRVMRNALMAGAAVVLATDRRSLLRRWWPSALLLIVLAWFAWPLFNWAVRDAVFAADEPACRAALGQGACWGVVAEKFRPILFGRYPYAEQWRPALGTLLLAALITLSTRPTWWRWRLLLLWLAGMALFNLVMGGGALGLTSVATTQWGGLPLTVMLAVIGTSAALPMGVLLALARHGTAPLPRALATVYIEAVRGVPLVTILFMASFLVPLLVPMGWQLSLLTRVVLALVGFSAAYLAEVVRGGLQSVPAGQVEAARALGMTPWQVQRCVVLPLALRTALPALMNSFIGILKDTSLVTVVGLHELTGALSLALGGDPTWRSFYIEGYLFVAAIYWAMCHGLSRYSRRLERR